MDKTTAIVIVAAIFAGVVIFFFTRFLGKGKFKFKNLFGEVTAEGSNPPVPNTTAAGVKIKEADAGKNIRAHSSSGGGVELEKVKAKDDIEATHSPGNSPPKK
jgi:hypothetical protein